MKSRIAGEVEHVVAILFIYAITLISAVSVFVTVMI